MIIGVLNQKGGVGKTTIAVNLAAIYAQDQNRVLLVDADPQGSSLAWSAARESKPPFSVVGMPTTTVHRDLPDVARGYDVVVIDGPPRTTDIGRAAILASDLVIIPVQPSPYDVWATQDVIKLIGDAQIYRPQIKALFVINRKIVNTAIGRDVGTALAQFGLPVCDIALHQRVVYAESAMEGLSVAEKEPKGEGAKELQRLAESVYAFWYGLKSVGTTDGEKLDIQNATEPAAVER
jgi:chromosome partitioning protein